MKKPLSIASDYAAPILFTFSIAAGVFLYGFVVGRYHIFPSQLLTIAKAGLEELKSKPLLMELSEMDPKDLPWYYKQARNPDTPAIHNTGEAHQGLNLITKIAADRRISAEIIDMDGQVVQTWDIDWFKIWPDSGHLPDDIKPKSLPGTQIHGAAVIENGDIVFNLERGGTVRMDRNSNIVWKLPHISHHSITEHDDGNLWIPSTTRHTSVDPRYPKRKPPFDENTILEVSPDDGQILNRWSVQDVLEKNGYGGLLAMWTTPSNFEGRPRDDRLHHNDVEPFPEGMREGFFKKGDILVSLRNVNTVFVFNRHTEEIKYISSGLFIDQHDPDFIDGNAFSVFDNKSPSGTGDFHSRIVIISAAENTLDVFFESSPEVPFYTPEMGKHQWLPNGNVLITEAENGRAIEVNSIGEVTWEYVNYVDDGIVGVLSQAERLPIEYAEYYR